MSNKGVCRTTPATTGLLIISLAPHSPFTIASKHTEIHTLSEPVLGLTLHSPILLQNYRFVCL